MGEAEGDIKKINPNYTMDLLARFVSSKKRFGGNLDVKEENFEVELTLGLSTNGKFGVDPSCKKRKCSTFDPKLMKPVKIEEESVVSVFPAMRVMESICSISVETEEVRRKRKEVQSLRRMQAKRKRMAKRMNLRAVKECVAANLDESCEEHKGLLPIMLKGQKKCIDEERRSPTITRTSLPEQSDYESEVNNPVTSDEHQSNEAKEMLQKVMLGMPCVTKGEGANGKTIQGLLYPCKKGEDVKIVCICHGSFHSPSQFVKHAGGEDVDNPLKHIVVNPSSSFS